LGKEINKTRWVGWTHPGPGVASHCAREKERSPEQEHFAK